MFAVVFCLMCFDECFKVFELFSLYFELYNCLSKCKL